MSLLLLRCVTATGTVTATEAGPRPSVRSPDSAAVWTVVLCSTTVSLFAALLLETQAVVENPTQLPFGCCDSHNLYSDESLFPGITSQF